MSLRRLVGSAVIASLLCCAWSAATATAAPQLAITLNPGMTPLTHGDERSVYEVVVRNTASSSPAAGEVLTCSARVPNNPEYWFQVTGFSFQWLSNGEPATGPATQPSSTTSTYEVQPADVGHALQCEVLGENVNATSASFTPPLQAAPLSTPPTATAEPSAFDLRPAISDPEVASIGEMHTCSAPTDGSWSGSPTWTFRWLRNGRRIAGATTASYTIQPADEKTVIQCEALGTTGTGAAPDGGTVVAVSKNIVVGSIKDPFEPNDNIAERVSQLPFLAFSTRTVGPVDFEVELPGGAETYAYRVIDTDIHDASPWSCTKDAPTATQHAKVFCTRSDSLSPGSSFPPIELVERPGRDAPDLLTTRATVSGGGSPVAASAEDSVVVGPAIPFGFQDFFAKALDEAGDDYTQAGGHPFSVAANVHFTEHTTPEENITNRVGFRALNGRERIVTTDTPHGFVGNPQALTPCASAADVVEFSTSMTTCPPSSVAGGVSIESSEGVFLNEPIYEIHPEAGTPAQFAFGISTLNLIYTLTPVLLPEEGYAISLVSSGIPKSPELFSAPVTLCGFGARPRTINERGEFAFTGCRKPHEPGASQVPLLTNPTRCAERPTTHISADTWEHQGVYAEASYEAAALTGCEKVPFEPEIEIRPTSNRADSPTGLDVSLTMPTNELEQADGIAQANLAGATVVLPEGMAVNPSVAAGLEACGEAQFGMADGIPNDQPVSCPEASKIGTAEVKTPLVTDTLKGNVYVARQKQNPFGSLLALYLDLESKQDGLLLKVAGKVTPNEKTGQLTATFVENPQAPFSEVNLHLLAGPRAPLINPPTCGRYAIQTTMWPWTAPDPRQPGGGSVVSRASTFQVARGPSGGSCPAGAPEPHVSGGLTSALAGATSPFVLDVSRADGTGRFRSLDVALPPGLTAYLNGVPYCPDAALASIPSAEGTAAAQLDSPACPAASQIGTVTVAAGAGEDTFFLQTGKAYLAGPYKGAPLSIAIVTPALAGPFDLGNVVVRSGLYINPETAQVTVKSDPIPMILHGLLLDVRDIKVAIDRSKFILAPTNCDPMAINTTAYAPSGESAGVSNRFQVGGCSGLKFKPKLQLSLKGSTRHAGHPALKAVVTYPKQGAYANIARAQVNLPHSEFIDQSNLNKTCTKPVLLEGNCPAKSIYGKVKAWTPLLEKPLEGPVYLVGGYGYKLPALVAELNGQIRVLLVGKVDSGPNKGIRNTFEAVPDAPVEKFVLEMKGGPKYSLLENSEDLCLKKQRAIARFVAQNGRAADLRPVISTGCKKKHKAGRKKRLHRHGRGK
jgi:hypothetical protein